MVKIHNDRELTLLKCIYNECTLYIQSNSDRLIEKINGLTCSLYMLDIIENPLYISNYLDIIDLKELVANAIDLYESIKKIYLEKEINHERK